MTNRNKKQCAYTGKVMYRYEMLARAAADQDSRKGLVFKAYNCGKCGFFHIRSVSSLQENGNGR